MMALLLVLLEKGVLCVKRKLLEKATLKKTVLFPVSRHFVCLLAMKRVRNICFKNALAVPITMQHNMAIF